MQRANYRAAFVRLENIFGHLRNRLFKPTEIDQGKASHRLWKYFSRKHEAVPTPITLILWHFTLYLHHRPSPKKIKNKKVTNPLKFRFSFNKDADIVSKKIQICRIFLPKYMTTHWVNYSCNEKSCRKSCKNSYREYWKRDLKSQVNLSFFVDVILHKIMYSAEHQDGQQQPITALYHALEWYTYGEGRVRPIRHIGTIQTTIAIKFVNRL